MNQRGVSKIEVLIIALIIGVLGLMAVVAVSTARARTRDAVRLSDVRSTQAALELYFNDANSYPVTTEALPLGGSAAGCLNEDGFTSTCGGAASIYLDIVPTTPTAGLDGLSSCGGSTNAYCFEGTENQYEIQFELENANPVLGLSAGLNCATTNSLKSGACAGLSSAE
jgi:Tfp pilus assembly protein PilE